MDIDFSEYFYYDETSPTCLRWVKQFNQSAPIVLVKYGDVAGTKSSRRGTASGMSVGLNYKYYKVHRVIWELIRGKIPEDMVIDHLNGNPWDNRIENLKCKTIVQNCQNRGKNKNNISGCPNVYFTRTKEYPEGIWKVKILCNGVAHDKNFYVRKHGESAKENAIEWRDAKLKELNEKGKATYTERHICGEAKFNAVLSIVVKDA